MFICPYNEYLDLPPRLLAPHVGNLPPRLLAPHVGNLLFLCVVVMKWQILSIYTTFLTSMMSNKLYELVY